MLDIVKRHAAAVGLDVSRLGRRGICTHSLRKTALNNALEHGAKVEEVQQWAGHADIRTTQEYINYKEDDVEAAARRCQIR
jgi:integrase